MSRGLTENEAQNLIVQGFLEVFTKELPMEYAIEFNRLVKLEMEGRSGDGGRRALDLGRRARPGRRAGRRRTCRSQGVDRVLVEAVADAHAEPGWLREDRLAALAAFDALPVESNRLYTPYVDLRAASLDGAAPVVWPAGGGGSDGHRRRGRRGPRRAGRGPAPVAVRSGRPPGHGRRPRAHPAGAHRP